MIDWEQLFLMELIVTRMTGFVLFSPIFGRRGIPGIVKGGLIMVLSWAVIGATGGGVPVPGTLLEHMLRLLLELAVGLALGYVMRLFFAVAQFGGEIIDAQMGITMAQTYDASSQANMTVSGSLLNILMILIFFAENGHHTLLRLLLTSGELVPYGGASIGLPAAEQIVVFFLQCMLLSVKLGLPILAAEMLGELSMGILMKAIPQINAFVINMELKVIVGLVLLYLFLRPMTEFLLGVEQDMLVAVEQMLYLFSGQS